MSIPEKNRPGFPNDENRKRDKKNRDWKAAVFCLSIRIQHQGFGSSTGSGLKTTSTILGFL